jgi:excisionase family DNA binding protein
MCDALLLRVEEAARRLGLGRSATYLLIQRGALPSIKVGGSRRIVVSDLVEFVQRLKEQSGDD